MAELMSVKRRNVETRRGQILDAAAECFRRHGFDGAAMAEISKTAGMSVGHIYHYFENKEAIVLAIVDQEAEELLELFDSFERSDDILGAMVAHAEEGFLNHAEGRTAALFLEIIAQATRNPKIAARVEENDRLLRRRIREVVIKGRARAGVPEPADPKEVEAELDIIAMLFDGLSVRVVRKPDLDRPATLRTMLKVLRLMLRA
jgi:AcrR family transcriptional regulator